MPKIFKGSVERSSQIEVDVNLFLLNQLQAEVDQLSLSVATVSTDGPVVVDFVRKMKDVIRGLSLITDPSVLDTFGIKIKAISVSAREFFNETVFPVVTQSLQDKLVLFQSYTSLTLDEYLVQYKDMLLLKNLAAIQFITNSQQLLAQWKDTDVVLEEKKELII